MSDTEHNRLLEDLKKKNQDEYKNIDTEPEKFIKGLKNRLITEKIDKEELVKIHQQLYLYYYTRIEPKYKDLVEFFKNPENNDFRQTLYKIRNNTDFETDINNLKENLIQLYDPENTLKKAIIEFLDNVNNKSFYIKNIINIFKLYNNQPIDIKFIKPEIKKNFNDESERQFNTSYLDSIYTTEKSFLKTILRIEGDISSGINITSISGQKGINNQKKQLLYFCQLFIEIQDNNYEYNDIISLKNSYAHLITTLNDHIKNFFKNIDKSDYKIKPPYIINFTSIPYYSIPINHIDLLNKLRKYILNESLINQLIKEYNTYFSSTDKTPDKLAQQKKNEEYREIAKNKSEEHNKDLTNLIPLSKTKKIQNLALTSFNKATSKIPAYLNNIIIIIIFLIFLNLFITTYFYFTTSIQATANRSNCGGASLCEAETHRHLFLEDNGNDKARDIYIIIVVIFSIYLLSEIFKSYKDGIKFDDDENTISVVPILILFLYFIFIVGTISGIIDKAKSNNKNPEGINVVSSALFMFYLFVIILFFTGGVENALDTNYPSKIIKFLTVTIPLAIIGVEIDILAEGPRYDLFKGFSGDKFNLINPKFKANTALHIIFLVFYIIFFVVVVWFNKNIKALHIWGLVFLAFILFTLFTFILLSSLDFKNTNYTDWLKNITGSTSSMQYFVLLFPLLILYPFNLNISSNAIKLIVLYYVILFIIYLFYVYFVNHSNETGILSLESFQLYNWANEHKNENKKGSNSESNHKKDLNKVNTFFVAVLLIILIFIGGLNEDSNLDNIIYGIIVFILASYITGIVYLLYNELFPIQQASFNYKKNLVDINNKISQHIKVEEVEHTIDKNKIRVFKIANDNNELKDIHERIKGTEKQDKEMHMKNIRDIFSEISPKGSSYEDYRSQSTDQMQYEEYVYRLFSNWTNTDFKFQPKFYETIFGDDDFEQDSVADTYRLNSYKLYNSIILKLPKNKAELIEYMKDNDVISTSIKKIEANTEANIFIQEVFKIPKTNNIEYVIKKNYKYVTGEEGVIQKYNVLSEKELSCLYYSSNVARTETSNSNNSNLEESIKKSIKNFDKTKFKITNIATDTGVEINVSFPIYKLNQDIFDDFKNNYNSNEQFTFQLGDDYYSNMLSIDVKNEKKLNPAFYTIGYDYENYTYNDKDHQQMNKDTAYSIPARYYACSYLNYFPNEDGSMSKVKFAKNIKEDNYNPLNTKNTIIDRIAKSYNENAKETKIQLAPEKFQFLLVFLVILAIILLIFLFNIIKKYFTGDVYTPQMYVLGILGVFLTIFIFGEVIFARIK